MRKCKYTDIIKESPEELLRIERRQQRSTARDRIRFVRSLREGTCTTQKEAGALIGLKTSQSQAIWRLYREKGIGGLTGRETKRAWGKLDSHQIARLRQRLGGHDLYTQGQVAEWLSDEMGIAYTQSGISKLLARLKIKLKTGRPVNVRKDRAGEAAFKKTLRT